jgi:hypothetical protein
LVQVLDLDLEARQLAGREEDATADRHLHWFLWLARFGWVFVLCAFALDYYYANAIGRVRIINTLQQLGIPMFMRPQITGHHRGCRET